MYPGIEETLLPEINELVAMHGAGLNADAIPKKLLSNLPVDMRVVLNWNQNNTDIDLWVTDPDGERCFFGDRFTRNGTAQEKRNLVTLQLKPGSRGASYVGEFEF